jgi:transcriptional antiterminator NusG
VRNTRGCTGFVGPASEPTPISEEEVKKLFGIDLTPTVEVNCSVGDRVQISGTAMDGFIGVVQNINLEERTVDLLVSMFGRETPATLPITQVRTVDE